MDSVTIMLIPDDAYKAKRPKTKAHHLTVAYFGNASEMTPVGITRLRNTVEMLARFSNGLIPGKANGVGLFNAGDGTAVVDLIDGMGTFQIRAQVENLYGRSADLDGVTIDHTHGFTPHITREYLSAEDAEFYANIGPDDIDNLDFNFIAIGLWHGDHKFEVSL